MTRLQPGGWSKGPKGHRYWTRVTLTNIFYFLTRVLNPMAGNKNSGRREYAPTDEDRAKVLVLKAGGMTNEAIAVALGVSEPTLRKHFPSELDRATAKVRFGGPFAFLS